MKKLKLADNLINESASQAFYYMMSGGADETLNLCVIITFLYV